MKRAMLVLVSMVFLGVASVPQARAAEESAKKPASAEVQIDLNTATSEQLTELPGVGEKVAARIVAYRKKNGGFQKAEELMNVKGIGEKTFLRIRPFVEVSSKRTK